MAQQQPQNQQRPQRQPMTWRRFLIGNPYRTCVIAGVLIVLIAAGVFKMLMATAIGLFFLFMLFRFILFPKRGSAK